MAGPSKQFDQNLVLNKALDVFWEKGYEGTSMRDLVTHMGVNRASMYDTFGNKEVLYKKALENYSEHTIAKMKEIIEQPGSAQANLINYFQFMGSSEEITKQYGCFLNNTAVEMGPHSPEIAAMVREQWKKVEAIFKAALDRAIEQGEISASIDTTALAQFFNTLISGIAVHSKVGRPPEELAGVVKTAFMLLHSAKS